jgi:hypothetical protein
MTGVRESETAVVNARNRNREDVIEEDGVFLKVESQKLVG